MSSMTSGESSRFALDQQALVGDSEKPQDDSSVVYDWIEFFDDKSADRQVYFRCDHLNCMVVGPAYLGLHFAEAAIDIACEEPSELAQRVAHRRVKTLKRGMHGVQKITVKGF